MENRDICYVCDCDEYVTYDTNLYQCTDCGFTWQYDIKDKFEYNEKYLDYYKNLYEKDSLLVTFLRMDMIYSYIIKDDKTCETLLDVGFGLGTFLKRFEKHGLTCYGYDVHGVDVGVKWIDIKKTSLKFDIVTAFDSIEHMTFSEIDVLFGLNTKYIVISTPSAPKSIGFYPNWRHYKPNEHLCYFNEGTLERLMNKKGFKVLYRGFDEDTVRKYIRNNILTMIGVKK